MAITTGKIRYNLRDRGYRQHGKPRNFNIPLIVETINSQATQERVNGRGMLGFFGHWPRVKFGIWGVEGGVDGKECVPVEPAIVVTHLQAFPDGTIEHECEFLSDTEPGKIAARLHLSRAGGLSSVIDDRKPEFIGFDYVYDPNYRSNRGYALDHALGIVLDSADAEGLTLEAVDEEIRHEQLHALSVILDSANSERDQANKVIARLEAEREQLYSMLMKEKGPEAVAIFDSASTQTQYHGIRPLMLDKTSANRMFAEASSFQSAQVGQFQAPGRESDSRPADRLTAQAKRLMGF